MYPCGSCGSLLASGGACMACVPMCVINLQDRRVFEELGNGLGCVLETQSLATSGHNWGNAVIDGSTLVFMVDGKPAFRIPLPDVTQAGSDLKPTITSVPKGGLVCLRVAKYKLYICETAQPVGMPLCRCPQMHYTTSVQQS